MPVDAQFGETIAVSGVEARASLDRVTIRYASEEAIKSFTPPPGAQPLGNGVWTEVAAELTEVSVLLEIHNGFDSPLTMVAIKLPPEDVVGQPSLSLYCELGIAAAIAPGEARTVRCRGSDRTERVGVMVRSLVERTTPAPLPASAFYSLAGNVYNYPARPSGEESKARAAEPPSSAAAPPSTRRARTPLTIAILSFATLVASLVAAARVRGREVPGGIVSAIAGLVILFAAFALLVAHIAMRPNAGYEVLLGAIVLYYGTVPFVIAMLCLGGSIAGGNATPFRVFAACFGGLAIVPVLMALNA